jgi:hypothetical protein
MLRRSGARAATLLFLASLPVLALSLAAWGGERAQEIERLKTLVAEVQPAVAGITGFPVGEPVPVTVMDRAELKGYVFRVMEASYPDSEFVWRSECFARLGLIPMGSDLERAMTEMLTAQAAGLYDPCKKVFAGMLTLPAAYMTDSYQNMIVAHELTHALQDRERDIMVESRRAARNLDYEYAFRSILEGMATVVMFAYMEDVPVRRVEGTRARMRKGHGARAYQGWGSTPPYLLELLISPYAEGGAFVETWLRRNPDSTLAALMNHIPTSSEQVLHPVKYFEPDTPTPISLRRVSPSVPRNWDSLYENSLGEFDLLTLFTLHESPAHAAKRMAAGWDGLRFAAYRDETDRLVLAGTSIWDSARDAVEFREGFAEVLGEVNGPDRVLVEVQGERRVSFVIGLRARDPITREILDALSR